MKINLHIFILLLFLSCSEKDNKISNVTSFPQSMDLFCRTIKSTTPIFVPRAMFITNDKLVIYKEKEDTLFSFFSLPECSFLFNKGIKGEGPNDFRLLDTRSFLPTKNGFQVMEAGSQIYKNIEIKNNQLITAKSEQIFKEYGATNGFYPLSDSIYLSFGRLNDENEYSFYDKKNGSFTKTGKYPTWSTTCVDKPYKRFMTYLKNCVIHPDRSKFAVFYIQFKNFQIFDNKGILLHEVFVKIPPFTTNVKENPKEQEIYYIGHPYATSNYIYAVCANAKGNSSDKNGKPELHVWDWKGNPIACYKLNKQVSLFAISNDNNKMYALNRENDDELYIFDLPVK